MQLICRFLASWMMPAELNKKLKKQSVATFIRSRAVGMVYCERDC